MQVAPTAVLAPLTGGATAAENGAGEMRKLRLITGKCQNPGLKLTQDKVLVHCVEQRCRHCTAPICPTTTSSFAWCGSCSNQDSLLTQRQVRPGGV